MRTLLMQLIVLTFQLQRDNKFLTGCRPVVKWRNMDRTIFAHRCDIIFAVVDEVGGMDGNDVAAKQGGCSDAE
jgi:hypothetical protein